jgi:hypothetical protein
MEQKRINPSDVFFIKLGQGAKYFEECISKNIVKLGHEDIDHILCENGDWDKVAEIYRSQKINKRTVTKYVNELKHFYGADDKTLWIVLEKYKLWWCFAEKLVFPDSNRTKFKHVIGSWSSSDICGNELNWDKLSGKITKTASSPGATIVSYGKDERNYIVDRINHIERQEIEETKKCLEKILKNTAIMITHLDPKDFEMLIDLVFARSGLTRISAAGGTQKDFDIIAVFTLTNERYVAQIKCGRSNKEQFMEYKERFRRMDDGKGNTRFYYVVQSPDSELLNLSEEEKGNMKLLSNKDIAKLSFKYGLVGWIMDKTAL